jgi:glycosyltransferase involved in cell wall biosynthesis
MLTSFHDARDVRIFHKEALTLCKEHEVTVIAPGDIAGLESEGGIAIKIYRRERSKLLHWRNVLQLLRRAREERYDAYHAHEPGSLLVGVLMKKMRGGTLIYDSHEHYPAIIAENSSIPIPFRRLAFMAMQAIERLMVSSADAVITVSAPLARRFADRGNRVVLIYNVPFPEAYDQSATREKKVIHIGNVSRKRGLTEFIRALNIVRRSHPDVIFQVLGKIYDDEGYARRLARYVKRKGLEGNFRLDEWVSPAEVPAQISSSAVGVILFMPDSLNNRLGAPNKLFEYMAAGIPVVASDLPGLRAVVSGEGCGVLVDPRDPHAIARAIDGLLRDPEACKAMGERGRRAVLERYNWHNMEPRLLECYRPR